MRGVVTVHHDGPLRGELVSEWGDLPIGTPLLGRAWFGVDRVYGRFTEVLLPSGESQPICLEMIFNGPGVPMLPGHTRTTARINAGVGAQLRAPNTYP